jgi:tripartite-type tricarboxylate transporter receptor subunit TctC
MTVMVPLVLVTHPSLNVGNLQELMKLLRDNPGKYHYGSAGNGTSGHIACFLFADMIGAKVEHIPYKGTGPVMTDMLAGRLTYTFDAPSVLAPHIQAGALKAMAIATPSRLALLPGVPTMAEAGLKGYEAYSWNAFWAPAGTPAPILDKLNAAVIKVLAEPAIREQLDKMGVPIMPAYSRAETARFMQAESDKWVPIVRASGARAD